MSWDLYLFPGDPVNQRFGVMGGGPAGCAAAFELRQQGHEVVLFEQAAALGGRTSSWRDASTVLDTGAGFFTNFYPGVQALLARCGLLSQRLELARSTLLVSHGREAALSADSPLSLATFPFVSMRERARIARLGASSMLRYRDQRLGQAASLAACDDESVADFARRRLGNTLYQYLIRPTIEPFWYFSCEAASRALLCLLLARAANARFYTLRGGMDSLCQALAVGTECRLQTPVEEVALAGSQVRVRTAAGDELFHGVVMATPATATARLLAREVPLAPGVRSFVESQEYVPNVHVAYQVAPGSFTRSVSSVFPCGPGQGDIAAVSINRCKGQGDPHTAADIISVFLSAARSAQALTMPPEELAALTWRAARAFYTALPEQASLHSVHARAQAIPVHAVGRFRRAAQCMATQAGPVVLAGDYLATATVEGAVRSGQQAAATLLAQAQANATAEHAA